MLPQMFRLSLPAQSTSSLQIDQFTTGVKFIGFAAIDTGESDAFQKR